MTDCIHCTELKCPRCEGTALQELHRKIEPDGAESRELICPQCNHKFLDVKLPYASLDPESMVNSLAACGLNVPEELARRIKETSEAIPFLLKVINDDACWNATDSWAPIHAMHLLSAMKATEALPAILDALKKDPDRFGDWLTEHVPMFLFHLGEGSIDLLTDFLKDKSADPYSRNAASRALAAIAYHNRELKSNIIPAFKELLRDADDENPALIAFSVEEAASLQDEELFSLVKQAFDNGLVSKDITGFEFSEEAFRTGLPHALDKDTADPMEQFKRENINRLMSSHYPGAPKMRKVGRNEPCPCGSGKKYKKCCMEQRGR